MADRTDKRSYEASPREPKASSALDDVLPRLAPPTEEEAVSYYGGLPSCPRLVGRTSSGIEPWAVVLLNPGEPYLKYRHRAMSPIGQHRIRESWEDVRPQILAAISGLPWTSVDIFRIGNNDAPAMQRPVVVWVGIGNADNVPWDAVALALRQCRIALDRAGLADVECELRASEVFPLAGPGPRLLPPTAHREFPDIARPFTTAVGQSMSPTRHESIYGTLCIYLRSTTSEAPRLWALTCRHVALPNSEHPDNKHYHRGNTSQPPLKMAIPTTAVVSDALLELGCEKNELSAAQSRDGITEEEKLVCNYRLKAANELYNAVLPFQTVETRAIGSVFLSPPIGPGAGWQYPWTRDWALVELDAAASFPPAGPVNEVDLRTRNMSRFVLQELLNPNVQNRDKFVFPPNGLLRLRGVIPIREMQNPTTLDRHGEECVLVGKRGAASGLTWGCPSELMSTVRQCLPDGGSFVSTEWAVKGSLQRRTQPFADGGDSGAAVFDVHGRLGGMLTRGSARPEAIREMDITYVTPMEMLLADIEKTLGMEVALV